MVGNIPLTLKSLKQAIETLPMQRDDLIVWINDRDEEWVATSVVYDGKNNRLIIEA